MKKFLALLMTSLILMLGMTGCSSGGNTSSTYDIAMITDKGSIDDKSFNQCTWEGIQAYANSNKITYKYYKPTEQSNDAFLAAIQLAVQGGAKIIVTPGYLFEVPIYKAQDLYPNVKFLLIDGRPHNEDSTIFKTASNTVSILYAEEQSGYLAGYAAVKDGYTKLGFMGGMAVPAVVRYGYGFVQGADAAAKEMGISNIEMKYHYTGGFDATPEVQTLAASWYAEGTQVIFACGGAVGNSVMSAAEAAKAKVIGVDVDQSPESSTVITSAMKGITSSVQTVLTQFYANKFPGGEDLTYTAANNGVELPMKTSKFIKFTQAEYDALYAKLAAGSITILKDTDAADVTALPVTNVKVTFVQ